MIKTSYIIGIAIINEDCEQYIEQLIKDFNFEYYPYFEYSIVCGNDNKKIVVTAPSRDRISLLVKEKQRAIKFQELIQEEINENENEIELTQFDFLGAAKFIFNNKVFFDDIVFSISNKKINNN